MFERVTKEQVDKLTDEVISYFKVGRRKYKIRLLKEAVKQHLANVNWEEYDSTDYFEIMQDYDELLNE